MEYSDEYRKNLQKYDLEIGVHQDIELNAGILALCHCYYLRIPSQDKREQYLREIER